MKYEYLDGFFKNDYLSTYKNTYAILLGVQSLPLDADLTEITNNIEKDFQTWFYRQDLETVIEVLKRRLEKIGKTTSDPHATLYKISKLLRQ